MTPILRALFATGLILCSSTAVTAQDAPRIVTVNSALKYFTERLVGDTAEVVFPVPQDVDPSFWRPSVADISFIQSADLIVLNGAGFATWIDRVSLSRAKLVNTTAAIEDQLIVTKSITHAHGEGDTHSHEGVASYTWLDPTLAIAQSEAIAAAIIRRGLAPADDVEARLAELRADLEQLDADTSDSLASVQDIPLIVTHPRYQYLARRYGLSVASLEWDAGALPNQEERVELEKLTDNTGARILIWEATPPAGAVEAVSALSLRSVTFAPWANQKEDGDFLTEFRSAIQLISAAAEQIAPD